MVDKEVYQSAKPLFCEQNPVDDGIRLISKFIDTWQRINRKNDNFVSLS